VSCRVVSCRVVSCRVVSCRASVACCVVSCQCCVLWCVVLIVVAHMMLAPLWSVSMDRMFAALPQQWVQGLPQPQFEWTRT
jgi:hypothetical protein